MRHRQRLARLQLPAGIDPGLFYASEVMAFHGMMQGNEPEATPEEVQRNPLLAVTHYPEPDGRVLHHRDYAKQVWQAFIDYPLAQEFGLTLGEVMNMPYADYDRLLSFVARHYAKRKPVKQGPQ